MLILHLPAWDSAPEALQRPPRGTFLQEEEEEEAFPVACPVEEAFRAACRDTGGRCGEAFQREASAASPRSDGPPVAVECTPWAASGLAPQAWPERPRWEAAESASAPWAPRALPEEPPGRSSQPQEVLCSSRVAAGPPPECPPCRRFQYQHCFD